MQKSYKTPNLKTLTIIASNLTWNASRKLGLSYSKLPKNCTSIKVTNMDMLNDSLQFMSATNFCYKSKWTIWKINVSFYCENCKNTLKSFNTSKATSLLMSNTKPYEMNVRSVLVAAVPISQAGLKRIWICLHG